MGTIIIKKTYESYGGDKIYKIDRQLLINDSIEITDIYYSLSGLLTSDPPTPILYHILNGL